MLSPTARGRRAGIVTFLLPHEAPGETFQRLKKGGAVCAERGGGVRLSPHFYTADSVIDQALACCKLLNLVRASLWIPEPHR